MKCCCLGYDQGVILLNVVELCLAAASTGLLVYKKPPDEYDADSVKMILVLGFLIGCMVVNVVLIVRTLLCSKTRIHLLLRFLVTVVGTALLITCAAFVIEEAMLDAEKNNDNIEEAMPDAEKNNEDDVLLWTIAALIIVNALLYLLESLVILRFYLFTMCTDTGDY